MGLCAIFLVVVHVSAMERNMLNTKWQDHVTNNYLKKRTKLPDLFDIILKRKWRWAGPITGMSDNGALELTKWKPTTNDTQNTKDEMGRHRQTHWKEMDDIG